MPRRNRVDPFGDLHAVSARGMFTGNRGCLVDDDRNLVRHHHGSLWIICETSFRGWRHPLDQPHRWTPLFFLDEAVALAAGHRPCGFCRPAAYAAYRDALTAASGRTQRWTAPEMNRRLAAERLHRARGLDRASDRHLWTSTLGALPRGAVVLVDNIEQSAGETGRTSQRASRVPHLVIATGVQSFSFSGWGEAHDLAPSTVVEVLTPPLSIAALAHGFTPELDASAR
jgi:hypothetical protein